METAPSLQHPVGKGRTGNRACEFTSQVNKRFCSPSSGTADCRWPTTACVPSHPDADSPTAPPAPPPLCPNAVSSRSGFCLFQIHQHSYTGYYVLSKIPHG